MTKFDPIRSWIKGVGHSHSDSEGTENNYSYYINIFFEYVGKSAEEILDEYESSTDREFRRKYARYVKALIADKMDAGYSPNTIANLVTTIQSFFKYNDLPLGFIPRGKRRVIFHNRDIAKEEIIKILGASRPREKAFFIMMAQTGLRPTTLCKLKLKHILPDFKDGTIPCEVEVPQELAKGKYRSYFSFMGSESVKALQAYFAMRKDLNKESFLFVSHGRNLTEMSPKTFSAVFNRTARKLKQTGELDFEMDYKKPAEIRLYNLRKYFRKYANQAGFEFVQFWMGHIVQEGVDEHYRPKDVEFHRKLYAEKAMPFLRIEEATPTETERTIEELREQLRKEQESRAQKDKLIEEQEKRLKSLEEFQRETLQRIHELAEFKREMKHFEKGGAVVTYHSKAGFLPKEAEEVADETLERQKEKFLKEAEEIDKVLRRRRKQ